MRTISFYSAIIALCLTCGEGIFAQTEMPEAKKEAPKVVAPEATERKSDYDDKRRLTDLMYMTNKGDRASSLGYSYGTVTTSLYTSPANLPFSNRNTKLSTLDLKYYYGLTDNFYIAMAFSDLISQQSDSTYGAGAGSLNGQISTLNYEGLKELAVELKWRALRQEASTINVNIGFGYSPKMSNQKPATVTDNGNAMRGGDQTDLLLQLGNKFQTFGYSLELDYRFLGTSTSVNSTGVRTDTTVGNQFSANLNFQWYLTDWFTVNLGVERDSAASTQSTSSIGGTTKENEFAGYAILASGFFTVVPEKLYLEFDYTRGVLSAHDFVSGSSSYKFDDQVVSLYGLKVLTTF